MIKSINFVSKDGYFLFMQYADLLKIARLVISEALMLIMKNVLATLEFETVLQSYTDWKFECSLL